MSFRIDTSKPLFHDALKLTEEEVVRLSMIMDNFFANGMTLVQISDMIQTTQTYTNKERFYLTFLMGYTYRTMVMLFNQQKKENENGTNSNKEESKENEK